MKRVKSTIQRVVLALLVSSFVSVLLFAARAIHYNTWNYWFLNWNLVLAWLPLIFAWQLCLWLRQKHWLSWQGIALTLLWLGFLPNSFYISSDLIHLQHAAANNILYDVAMFLSFTINGYLIGFISLYLIHRQLMKRLKAREAHLIITIVLLLCSFAIYLGRYLRWSTWDVLINPAGLLFDISDRILNPSAHPQTFVTTATFFVLLSSIYFVLWQLANAVKPDGKD